MACRWSNATCTKGMDTGAYIRWYSATQNVAVKWLDLMDGRHALRMLASYWWPALSLQRTCCLLKKKTCWESQTSAVLANHRQRQDWPKIELFPDLHVDSIDTCVGDYSPKHGDSSFQDQYWHIQLSRFQSCTNVLVILVGKPANNISRSFMPILSSPPWLFPSSLARKRKSSLLNRKFDPQISPLAGSYNVWHTNASQLHVYTHDMLSLVKVLLPGKKKVNQQPVWFAGLSFCYSNESHRLV